MTPHPSAHPFVCLTFLASFLAVLAVGCAGPEKTIEPRTGAPKGITAAQADSKAAEVRADPRAYLYRVAERCGELDKYTLEFTRQERRGLFQKLYGPEHIFARFRQDPFSVYMRWHDDDIKYYESVYVEDEQDGRIRFVPRKPTFGLKKGINTVEVQTPVIWGEAKRPITDFGLRRLMERTLASVEEAGEDVVITYEGLLQMENDGPLVHHVRLEYADHEHRVPIQDLYINVATDLPAGTILKYHSGRVDAAYLYQDVDTDVSFTDSDFMLEAELEKSAEAEESGGGEAMPA